MSGSTFGELFRVTNFGESHGPAIGCVIDGCPPGLQLSEADIQPELDRRRPGTSRQDCPGTGSRLAVPDQQPSVTARCAWFRQNTAV